MSALVFVALLSLSLLSCCSGSAGVPVHQSDQDVALYGKLVARIERLEQRDQQQARQITALESKMAAMADLIQQQEREIETLKNRATDDSKPQPPASGLLADQVDTDTQPDVETDTPSTDVPESAIRALPGATNVPKFKRAAANGGKVAFYARMDVLQSEHLGVGQNIIFEKVVVNIGNSYNPHHGIFVAPVSGTYLVSSSIMAPHNKEIEAYIAVNGNPVANIWSRDADGRHDQGSQTIVLTLQQGDDVSIRNWLNDDAVYGHDYSTFSGVLLWPTSSESVIVG